MLEPELQELSADFAGFLAKSYEEEVVPYDLKKFLLLNRITVNALIGLPEETSHTRKEVNDE